MGTALRRYRNTTRRGGERIPLHSRMQVSTLDGEAIALPAVCLDIGLGGIRALAARGPKPGTLVRVDVRLPSGRHFRSRGRVAWSKTTLHPALLGTPRGQSEDSTLYGIAFADISTQELLPIARLLVAREGATRRARRIRRLHGLPNHA